MAQSHIIYRGRVADPDTAQQGQTIEIRATREHSGCLVLEVRHATPLRCIGFFEDQDQAIEEAVNLANDQRGLSALAKYKAKAVTA
jgi:hypothetical protein